MKQVTISGIDTSKLPNLSSKENLELLKAVKDGDLQAREQVIKGNLKLVLSVVQRFSDITVSYDDIFQQGCIGLIKAVDYFDVLYGTSFSSYAIPMIVGYIRRYLRDCSSLLRVPRSLHNLSADIRKLRERAGTNLTVAEIAETLKVPREEVAMAIAAKQPTTSLDQPFASEGLRADDEICLYDALPSEEWQDSAERQATALAVRKALKRFKPRMRKLVFLRYYLDLTQEGTARAMGVSQAQVSRLEGSIKLQLTAVC